MSLTIDTSRAARLPSERLAVVEAVLAAAPGDETDWIEWKVQLGGGKDDRVDLARHILGFANRDPVRAANFNDGCAYIVVGASPGDLPGVVMVDPATLENRLTPYVGSGPRWGVSYEHLHGKDVLFVTVEEPRPGDSIWPLRREFGDYLSGTIFVRRQGKTHQADAGEIEMLERRAQRGSAGRLELEVEWMTPPAPVPVLDASDGSLDDWVNAERTRYMRAYRIAQATGSGWTLPSLREDREPREYGDEVERYLRDGRGRLPARLRQEIAERAGTPLRLVARNPTSRNFAKVLVELVVAGSHARFYAEPDDLEADFPEPPELWAEMPFLSGTPHITYPTPGGPVVLHDTSGSRIRFSEFDLRPSYEHHLEPFGMVLDGPALGSQLTIEWHATSTDVDQLVGGELTVEADKVAIRAVQAWPVGDGI
jgi:hypothetical protein